MNLFNATNFDEDKVDIALSFTKEVTDFQKNSALRTQSAQKMLQLTARNYTLVNCDDTEILFRLIFWILPLSIHCIA